MVWMSHRWGPITRRSGRRSKQHLGPAPVLRASDRLVPRPGRRCGGGQDAKNQPRAAPPLLANETAQFSVSASATDAVRAGRIRSEGTGSVEHATQRPHTRGPGGVPSLGLLLAFGTRLARAYVLLVARLLRLLRLRPPSEEDLS